MMDLNELAWLRDNGLTIDLFAGGGGWGQGHEQALGRHTDIALNHDRYAVTLHAANHPRTQHLCQDIYSADPLAATRGRPVFWIHASPSCTQFSRSRRALPAERQLREMGWKVVDWVRDTMPVVISMENVADYLKWGPLDDDGFPIRERMGETWQEFVQAFRDLGYVMDWTFINSADFGAPTARERLLVVGRRDGIQHEWPVPTHGPRAGIPYEGAWRHIDWSIPAPSIFTRPKELAPATQTRIFKGYQRFVEQDPDPFLAPAGTQVGDGKNRSDLVAAFMAQNHALLPGRSLRQPSSTICTKGAGQGLITASFVNVLRNNAVGTSMRQPLNTLCASGGHFAEVRVSAMPTMAYGIGYYSNGGGQMHDLAGPIGTITTRDRFALVTIHGVPHQLVDIGFRFLRSHELWGLQGFPTGPAFERPTFITNPVANGKPMTEERQKKMIGNSVVPHVAYAVTAAVLTTIDRYRPMRLAA